MIDIINMLGSEFGQLIVWIIFAIFGYGVKKIVTRILDTKEKRQLASDVVLFVEQKYTELHGADKFNKAVEAFTQILTEKGIKTSTTEIETLIESAVGAFNKAFDAAE